VPNYAVGASADDQTLGDGANTNGTLLVVTYNYGTTVFSHADATIDTSAIGTDTISAATFYWYHHAYTKTKTNSFHRLITLESTGIFNSSATPGAAGWHSVALDATGIAAINKTGNTMITFSMNDPTSGFNTWSIRSWDYDGAGGYACYLAVTHAPGGGPTKFSILR